MIVLVVKSFWSNVWLSINVNEFLTLMSENNVIFYIIRYKKLVFSAIIVTIRESHNIEILFKAIKFNRVERITINHS